MKLKKKDLQQHTKDLQLQIKNLLYWLAEYGVPNNCYYNQFLIDNFPDCFYKTDIDELNEGRLQKLTIPSGVCEEE